MSPFLQTIVLTLELACAATLLLILLGVPLAYWLSSTSFRGRAYIEALTGLPLVLPPSVIGFYLLVAFSPEGAFGRFLNEALNIRLVFTFTGLVVASIIYSLPFMVGPVKAGFDSVPRSLAEASYSLGKSRLETIFRVVLPNMTPALLSGIVLTFAHTLGEFGIVLMIGGNIPGQTRVAAIAIYDEVEALHYASANEYSLVLLVIAFVILLGLQAVNRRQSVPLP
jgi:molybdate transport system permease protein